MPPAHRSPAARPPTLLRDYGLTLVLVLASLLLFWKTLLPQIQRNHELDQAYVKLLRRNQDAEAQIRRLELLQGAATDPLVLEGKVREYYGELLLPAGEKPLAGKTE